MQNRYIIILTVTTIIIILLCRLRNNDRKFRMIEVNGKLKSVLLFPVMIYKQTTIGSLIICISYEVLIVLSMILIYAVKVNKSTVCYFWGTLQMFSVCIAAMCENFVEWKKQEETRKKNTYFILGIFFAIASIAYLTMQIHEFLEVV